MPAASHISSGPTGHAWARMSDAACLMRRHARTASLSWHGLLATNGWRMPPGRLSGSDLSLIDRKGAEGLSARIVQAAKEAAGRILSVTIVHLEPARERLLRGGAVRLPEADLLFGPDVIALKGRRMVTAAVPLVGGIILVRALSDGFVELVPFSLDGSDPQHEVRRGPSLTPVNRFIQCHGEGFSDPLTQAPLVDLSALDLFHLCREKSPRAAANLLSDCLFGPINDLLGRPFESMTSSPGAEAAETPEFVRDVLAVASIFDCGIKRLVWSSPRSPFGHPRLIAVEAITPADTIKIVAMFSVMVHSMSPAVVADDPTTEPSWPWNPRRAARHDVTPAEISSHDQLEALLRVAKAWHGARRSPAEAWRFHDLDGKALPEQVLAELDGLLPRPEPGAPA